MADAGYRQVRPAFSSSTVEHDPAIDSRAHGHTSAPTAGDCSRLYLVARSFRRRNHRLKSRLGLPDFIFGRRLRHDGRDRRAIRAHGNLDDPQRNDQLQRAAVVPLA